MSSAMAGSAAVPHHTDLTGIPTDLELPWSCFQVATSRVVALRCERAGEVAKATLIHTYLATISIAPSQTDCRVRVTGCNLKPSLAGSSENGYPYIVVSSINHINLHSCRKYLCDAPIFAVRPTPPSLRHLCPGEHIDVLPESTCIEP